MLQMLKDMFYAVNMFQVRYKRGRVFNLYRIEKAIY